MATETTKPRATPEDAIPVRALHFNRGNGLSLYTGQPAIASITANSDKVGADKYEIAFVPRMRQFRVVLHGRVAGQPPRVFGVPESWAIAEYE